MGRSLESQTQATTTTTSASFTDASMENATAELDQKGSETDADLATSSASTSPPVPDSNGDAPTSHRLKSLTGLMMNQKSQQWNSTTSEASSTPRSPSTTDTDQSVPYFMTRPPRFDDDEAGPRRTSSFGSVASTLNAHRRAAALAAGGTPPGGSQSLTETDLRRFVFHHQRAKRLVSGLRVHAFTRQAFVSSFTVGLAIGSVVAIVLKILKDVASRMLYS